MILINLFEVKKMNIRAKIKKVLNYLNKTYTGSGNYESFNEDTASLDDAFTALREAISYENKLNISAEDCNAHFWTDERNVNNRIKMAKKLMNDMDLGSADQNTKLMNCALELNGYDTTFTDVYGEGITDAMDQFGQNLCTGTGNWEGLGLIQTVALISDVSTHLANDGKQNIRDAQIFINSCTSAYPVGVRNNDSVNYILGRTDGIINKWSLKGAFLAFQSIIDAPFSNEINQNTKDRAGDYFKDYNDRAKPLIKAMLILRGFLNVSLDKATTEEVNNAKTRFAQTSHTKVDSADFFIALFAFGKEATIYIGAPKYILGNKKSESILGYTTSSGFQALCHKDNKLSMLKYRNSLMQDSLFEFDLSKNNFSESPIKLSFDDDSPIFQENLGHTQSLFIDGDFYYMGCDSDESTKHKWAQDIIRYTKLDNKLIDPKKITNIKYLAKTLNKDADLNKIHRVDFAVSPDKKWIMIGLISTDGTQYEFLYNFNKFSKIFDYTDVNIDIKDVVLKWSNAYSISNFCDSKTQYPYTEKSKYFLPSVQGYALDNEKNVYLSSGLAPDKKVTKPNYIAHIAQIPWGLSNHDTFYDKKLIVQICFADPFKYFYPTEVLLSLMQQAVVPFAEPEAIQYCPEHNSVLLSVTWHLKLNDTVSEQFAQQFNLYNQDQTCIYEIPMI